MLLVSGIMMELMLEMYSYCVVGDDGENIYQMMDNILFEGYVDGKVLFCINIFGIMYVIGLYFVGKGIIGWFFVNSG